MCDRSSSSQEENEAEVRNNDHSRQSIKTTRDRSYIDGDITQCQELAPALPFAFSCLELHPIVESAKPLVGRGAKSGAMSVVCRS